MVNYTPKFEHVETVTEHQMNLEVKDFMIEDCLTLNVDMNIVEAMGLIAKHDVTGAPVVDKDRRLLGFLSEKDCLKFVMDMKYYNEGDGRVGDYMAKKIMSVRPFDSLIHTVELFIKNNFQIYPIVDEDGLLQGVVTRKAAIREINKMGQTIW